MIWTIGTSIIFQRLICTAAAGDGVFGETLRISSFLHWAPSLSGDPVSKQEIFPRTGAAILGSSVTRVSAVHSLVSAL